MNTEGKQQRRPAVDHEVFIADETTDRTTGRRCQKIAMWQTADSQWAFFEWTLTKPGQPTVIDLWPEGADIAALTMKLKPGDRHLRQEFPVGTQHLRLNVEWAPAGFNVAIVVRTKPGLRVCGQLTLEFALDA